MGAPYLECKFDMKIMKRLEFRYLSSIVAISGIWCMPSCAPALPEHTAQNTSINDAGIQMKARPCYIGAETLRKLRIEKARQRMRVAWKPLDRQFYLNPKEKRGTFSIGDTRDGWLVHGQGIKQPSLKLRQLPVQLERGLAYGTPELVRLLEDTADEMQKRYPATVMYLGNLSAVDGGDIPYSISHNSGRDGDIAFYLKDADGKQPRTRDLLKIDRRLRAQDGAYVFDVEKNAALVERLLMHPDIHVQFIFVARHLRSALYQALISKGADAEVLSRFEQSVQNQSAHDDHFHVRVYCAREDICAGCVDRSVIHPYQEDPLSVREKCIERHERTLSAVRAAPVAKAVALERLALMGEASTHVMAIEKALSHSDARVRRAAARALRAVKSAHTILSQRYMRETDAGVRLEILRSLASFPTAVSRDLFHRVMVSDERHEFGVSALVAGYLSDHPDASDAPVLVRVLKDEANAEIWRLFSDAFDIVANRAPCTGGRDACMQGILGWFEKNKDKPRIYWLVSGFREAGYPVSDRLLGQDIAWLLDAVEGPRSLSVNAQLLLKKIGHLEQDSLRWPVSDALWHYTRYFKRREKKYGVDLSDRDDHGRKLALSGNVGR